MGFILDFSLILLLVVVIVIPVLGVVVWLRLDKKPKLKDLPSLHQSLNLILGFTVKRYSLVWAAIISARILYWGQFLLSEVWLPLQIVRLWGSCSSQV